MVAVDPSLIWLSIAVVTLTTMYIRRKLNQPYSNAPVLSVSFIEKLKLVGGMTEFVKRGYEQFGGATFQYTTFRGRRQVLVCNDELINELKMLPAENASFASWSQVITQVDAILPLYAGGAKLIYWPEFAVKISHRWFKSTLWKDLYTTFPQLYEDVVQGWATQIDSEEPLFSLARKAIMPTVARYLVGAPLCNDPEFLEKVDELTHHIGLGSQISLMMPKILKRPMVRCFTKFFSVKAYMDKTLHKLAAERSGKTEGLYDYFSVALAAVEKSNKPDWNVDRIITDFSTNAFAAHHTTSTTMSNVLLELAVRPEYQSRIREEVRRVTAEKGWTLEAIDEMVHLDSFMRESRRFRPLADMMVNRLVNKDTTLSDGTKLSRGMNVSALYSAREMDDTFYKSPKEFDGFRFVGSNDRFTDADGPRYLAFGAGKHACPGRFFAAAIVKTSVAHLLDQYELLPGSEKLEFEISFEEQRLPSMKDRVLFKRL
ncbi:cytochrome P450 [Pyronema domesticum]|uniref:Similar to Ent-kaurene oxidase acc. no. Q701P2 n=1 Tax=Pyronema omphalodes (strain CBS 100304) TaxID=1076935 RepID=U4LJY2_PYROM|nr:cytochrome P450 [Pyronema domesticum]CCX32394.1 Similar to Ent-kaurene oxidase; acc. no. Q701P2 [Pyronema omphalodes CBS 100304]